MTGGRSSGSTYTGGAALIVRMTEDGRNLETVRIGNSPAALRREIAEAGQHPRVVVEATFGWYWAVDMLKEA